MKIVRHTDKNFSARIGELFTGASLFDAAIEERTRTILQDVYLHGDQALLELTEKFDGAKLTAEQLAVTQAELFNASLNADESLRAAVAEAVDALTPERANEIGHAALRRVRAEHTYDRRAAVLHTVLTDLMAGRRTERAA